VQEGPEGLREKEKRGVKTCGGNGTGGETMEDGAPEINCGGTRRRNGSSEKS